MAFGVGFIIGPFIGEKLADSSLVGWFDFSTPFFFTALLTLINIILVAVTFIAISQGLIPLNSSTLVSNLAGRESQGKFSG